MVLPAFGWSVSDIAGAIRVTVKLCKAFKGGAGEKYQECFNFLESFKTTFEHLTRYAEEEATDRYAATISNQAKQLEQPWRRFETFVAEYEASLGKDVRKNRFIKSPKVAAWTWKEMSGEIQKLKTSVIQPLEIINTVLSLQTINSLTELAEQPFNATQLDQLRAAMQRSAFPEEAVADLRDLKSKLRDVQESWAHTASRHVLLERQQITMLELQVSLESRIEDLTAKISAGQTQDSRIVPGKNEICANMDGNAMQLSRVLIASSASGFASAIAVQQCMSRHQGLAGNVASDSLGKFMERFQLSYHVWSLGRPRTSIGEQVDLGSRPHSACMWSKGPNQRSSDGGDIDELHHQPQFPGIENSLGPDPSASGKDESRSEGLSDSPGTSNATATRLDGTSSVPSPLRCPPSRGGSCTCNDAQGADGGKGRQSTKPTSKASSTGNASVVRDRFAIPSVSSADRTSTNIRLLCPYGCSSTASSLTVHSSYSTHGTSSTTASPLTTSWPRATPAGESNPGRRGGGISCKAKLGPMRALPDKTAPINVVRRTDLQLVQSADAAHPPSHSKYSSPRSPHVRANPFGCYEEQYGEAHAF